VGDYQVAVRPLPIPAPHDPPLPKDKIVKIPAQYTQWETSGLTVTVNDGNNLLQLELNDQK